MADKRVHSQFRYKIEMTYLNLVKNKNTEIKTECIKYLIVDHQYDTNCMPIIYAGLNLDRALVDDMILNINSNLMLIAVFKYDDLTDSKEPIEVIRDKFTYFLPNDVNKTMDMDYKDEMLDEHLGNTFRSLNVGFMPIRLINLNKRMIEINVSNNNIYDCARYCLYNHENVIIEPFIFSDVMPRIIVPPCSSVNNALKMLNSIKVFYYTPYRFYMDFNYTYLISSSGESIPNPKDVYGSVVFNIRDPLETDSNDEGIVLNKTAKVYEVPINYVNTVVYDNTIANKSQNRILGISSSGTSDIALRNKADYASQDKYAITRINNDNTDIIHNMVTDIDSHNFFIFLSKNDLDVEAITINKQIVVHNINRYQDFDGNYLMTRKRELFMRDNDTFLCNTMINLRKLDKDSTVTSVTTEI